MKATGNARANARFESSLPSDRKLTSEANDAERELFIRRKWIDREYALAEDIYTLLIALEVSYFVDLSTFLICLQGRTANAIVDFEAVR